MNVKKIATSYYQHSVVLLCIEYIYRVCLKSFKKTTILTVSYLTSKFCEEFIFHAIYVQYMWPMYCKGRWLYSAPRVCLQNGRNTQPSVYVWCIHKESHIWYSSDVTQSAAAAAATFTYRKTCFLAFACHRQNKETLHTECIKCLDYCSQISLPNC